MEMSEKLILLSPSSPLFKQSIPLCINTGFTLEERRRERKQSPNEGPDKEMKGENVKWNELKNRKPN